MPTIKLTAPERAKLRQYFTDKFSLPELRNLAFDLDVDYQHIPHTTTLEFAPELVRNCERTEQLPELLELALELRPNSDIAALLHRLKPAPPPPIPETPPQPPTAKTELDLHEAEQLDIWLSQLEKAEKDKDWDRVISLGEQILTLDSDNSDVCNRTAVAYYWKGLSFIQEGKYTQAITQYTKATRYYPNFATIYNNRGFAYAWLKQYERAIEDYNAALKLDPNYAVAHYNRGLLYKERGDKQKARDDFQQAEVLGYEPAKEN